MYSNDDLSLTSSLAGHVPVAPRLPLVRDVIPPLTAELQTATAGTITQSLTKYTLTSSSDLPDPRVPTSNYPNPTRPNLT